MEQGTAVFALLTCSCVASAHPLTGFICGPETPLEGSHASKESDCPGKEEANSTCPGCTGPPALEPCSPSRAGPNGAAAGTGDCLEVLLGTIQLGRARCSRSPWLGTSRSCPCPNPPPGCCALGFLPGMEPAAGSRSPLLWLGSATTGTVSPVGSC